MGILIGIAIAIAAFVTLFNIYEYKSLASTNSLRDLLASRKWEEANKETERLLALTTNRSMGLPESKERTRLNSETFRCIPCSILRTVDELWVQYSDGRFGFSIQLGILEECKKADDWKKKEVQEFDRINSSGYGIQGGRVQSYFQQNSYLASLADPVEVVMLWERLGWITRGYTDGRYTYFNRNNPELNCSLSAPKGQLPVYDRGTQLYDLFTLSILQRLKDCGCSVSSFPEAPTLYLQFPNSQPPSIDQPRGPYNPF